MFEIERTINDLEPGASVQVDKGLVFRLGPRPEYTYGDLKAAGGNPLAHQRDAGPGLQYTHRGRAHKLQAHGCPMVLPTVVVKVLQTKVGYRKYQFNHLLVATGADVDPSTLKGLIEAHPVHRNCGHGDSLRDEEDDGQLPCGSGTRLCRGCSSYSPPPTGARGRPSTAADGRLPLRYLGCLSRRGQLEPHRHHRHRRQLFQRVELAARVDLATHHGRSERAN